MEICEQFLRLYQKTRRLLFCRQDVQTELYNAAMNVHCLLAYRLFHVFGRHEYVVHIFTCSLTKFHLFKVHEVKASGPPRTTLIFRHFQGSENLRKKTSRTFQAAWEPCTWLQLRTIYRLTELLMYYSLLPNEFNFLFFIVVALVQEAAENCLRKINVLCHLNSIHSATITLYICYCWSTSLERPANRTPQHWKHVCKHLKTYRFLFYEAVAHLWQFDSMRRL